MCRGRPSARADGLVPETDPDALFRMRAFVQEQTARVAA
jgi:hypothetical protein